MCVYTLLSFCPFVHPYPCSSSCSTVVLILLVISTVEGILERTITGLDQDQVVRRVSWYSYNMADFITISSDI